MKAPVLKAYRQIPPHDGTEGAASREWGRALAGSLRASCIVRSPSYQMFDGRRTSLRQAQPDLAARRERRHGVAQPLVGDFADDRDRRRVQEVRDLGAGDRAADDDPPLTVDEPAGGPGRVATVERPARVP